LKKVLAAAEQQHGLTFRIGYEAEFVLLKCDEIGKPWPIDRGVYCQTTAFDAAAPGALAAT
jgi:glutamine synthetase